MHFNNLLSAPQPFSIFSAQESCLVAMILVLLVEPKAMFGSTGSHTPSLVQIFLFDFDDSHDLVG